MDASCAPIDELARLFARDQTMLPLYLAFEERVRETCGDFCIHVQKTQVTFSNRYNFACASLPVRRKRDWPAHCLMVTFGLAYRVTSPRIAVAVEPYPNRWTHHVLIESEKDIDAELMAWIREAYDFSLSK